MGWFCALKPFRRQLFGKYFGAIIIIKRESQKLISTVKTVKTMYERLIMM